MTAAEGGGGRGRGRRRPDGRDGRPGFGGMGTALCVTPDNRADMVTCEWGRHHDWSPYDFVVACGPRLLRRGRVVLDPRAERFHDQHMLAPNSRIAVVISA